MRFVGRPVALLRRVLARADRAVMRLVCKADEGIVGFVNRVEGGFRRVGRALRRDEQRVVRKTVATEQRVVRKTKAAEHAVADPVVGTVRAATKATSTLVRQVVSDTLAVAAAVFGAPGRLGRAGEALVAYWATGAGRFFGRVSLWVSAPVRKRVAKRAKEEALESITMTPDHKAHRELLALLAAGVLLLAGAAAMFGKNAGLRTPDSLRPENLTALPGTVWQQVVALSPLKLTILAALAALAVAGCTFWFRMVRDSYRREYATAVEQTQWRLVTTLLFIPGAVLYFFKQYNRLPLRKFAGRHVVSLLVSGVTILVATSTYGTLWYFNQQAQADVSGSGYQAPDVRLDPDERRSILSRDRYGEPLKPATSGRRDPFAPIPGEDPEPSPSPSPSPTPGT